MKAKSNDMAERAWSMVFPQRVANWSKLASFYWRQFEYSMNGQTVRLSEGQRGVETEPAFKLARSGALFLCRAQT
jgi:hypothetical protein